MKTAGLLGGQVVGETLGGLHSASGARRLARQADAAAPAGSSAVIIAAFTPKASAERGPA